MTPLPYSRYVEHLDTESRRIVEVLSGTDPTAPVPSCPEWTAADLAHHLAAVQSFWSAVVRGRLRTETQVRALREPPRESEFESQLAQLQAATVRLLTALQDTPPATPAWSWSTEQTVGFTYRRQALEALVHRIDAELTAGSRSGIDPDLAADGVDEALRIMYAGCPPWGRITAEPGGPVRVRATDTGHTWLVRLARFRGTDPVGQVHDEPDIVVAESDSGEDEQAGIAGAAADLLCWLWHRPAEGAVVHRGDPALLAAVQRVLDQPIT